MLILNGRLTHFLSNNLGWNALNPIQEKAIPIILDGDDTLVIAPTASGKTEAVLLPVFSEIISKKVKLVQEKISLNFNSCPSTFECRERSSKA